MLRGQLSHWNPQLLTIKSAPRVGQAYWIAMVQDAQAPEFSGYHPGVVIRACKSLCETTETVSFVPLTSTAPLTSAPYVHQLSRNPNPADGRTVWAVCNHIYTVRLSRLELYLGKDGRHLAPKIDASDLKAIFMAILNGFTAQRTHIENEIKDRVKNMAEKLDADFEARVAAAVAAELDAITSPTNPG
jgi:uncharacterized protein YifN (PemK superfamily)